MGSFLCWICCGGEGVVGFDFTNPPDGSLELGSTQVNRALLTQHTRAPSSAREGGYRVWCPRELAGLWLFPQSWIQHE